MPKGQRKLRVGFDLDGVLIGRPPLIPKPVMEYFFKSGRKGLYFPFPGRLEQLIRRASHFWLLRPPLKRNLAAAKRMAARSRCQVFLVSGRYAFLETKTRSWLTRRNLLSFFPQPRLNLTNQPPHLFKEAQIKELGLDVYFEDDPAVVEYLSDRLKKVKIILVARDGDCQRKRF